MAQTFWVLDTDTFQPICFTTGTASRSVVDATPQLMDLTEAILQPEPGQSLVVADTEHFSGELISDIHQRTGLDLLVPLPSRNTYRKKFEAIPESSSRVVGPVLLRPSCRSKSENVIRENTINSSSDTESVR